MITTQTYKVWTLDSKHPTVSPVCYHVDTFNRYYHQIDKFHNLLRLLSNEVVHRAIALVGEDILREPLEVRSGCHPFGSDYCGDDDDENYIVNLMLLIMI